MFLLYVSLVVCATSEEVVAVTNQTFNGLRNLAGHRYYYENCYFGQKRRKFKYLQMGILVERGVLLKENNDRAQVRRKVDEVLAFANEIYGEQMDIKLRIDKFLVATTNNEDRISAPSGDDGDWWWDVPGADGFCQSGERSTERDPRYSALMKWVKEHFGRVLGLWHLFTTCHMRRAKNVLGQATKGGLCKENGLNIGWTLWKDDRLIKLTFTHEVGHNFGAPHLTDDVSGAKHIMHPWAGIERPDMEFHHSLKNDICGHVSASMSITETKRLNKNLYTDPDRIHREYLSKGLIPDRSFLLARYQHSDYDACWSDEDAKAFHPVAGVPDVSSGSASSAEEEVELPAPEWNPANKDEAGWGLWASWGVCSKSCDGIQRRIRHCLQSSGCWGQSEEKQPCDTEDCQATRCAARRTESDCSVPCGQGKKKVTITYEGQACGVPVIQWQECHLPTCAAAANGLTCSAARVRCDNGTSKKNGDPRCGANQRECDAHGRYLCCEICVDRSAPWPTSLGKNCHSLQKDAAHFCEFETVDRRFKGVESACCACGGGDRSPIRLAPRQNNPRESPSVRPRNPSTGATTPQQPRDGEALTCSAAGVRCEGGDYAKRDDPLCGTMENCQSKGRELCCEMCVDRQATWQYDGTCVSLEKAASYFCGFEQTDPERFGGVESACCACGGGDRSPIRLAPKQNNPHESPSVRPRNPSTGSGTPQQPRDGEALTCSAAGVRCEGGDYVQRGDPVCGTMENCQSKGRELCCEMCVDREATWPTAFGENCTMLSNLAPHFCQFESRDPRFKGVRSVCCACGGGSRRTISTPGHLSTQPRRAPRNTPRLTCSAADVLCEGELVKKNGDPECGTADECAAHGQTLCCERCTDRSATWLDAMVVGGQTCTTVLQGRLSFCYLDDRPEWKGLKSQCCLCGGGDRRPPESLTLTCADANVQCSKGTSLKNSNPVCGSPAECTARGQEQCCDAVLPGRAPQSSRASQSSRSPDQDAPRGQLPCDVHNSECTGSEDTPCRDTNSCTRKPSKPVTRFAATWDKRYLWALLPLLVAVGLVVYALLCTQGKGDSGKHHKKMSAGNSGSMDAPMEDPLQPQGDAAVDGASLPAGGVLRRLSSTISSGRERARTAQETLPYPVDLKRSSKKSRTSRPVTHQSRRSNATDQTARLPRRNLDAAMTRCGRVSDHTAQLSDTRSHHVGPTQRSSVLEQTVRRSEDKEPFSPPRIGSNARRSKRREMPPCAL